MMISECRQLQEMLETMRHDLHRIPEIGKNLPKTQQYIINKLEECGIDYQRNEGDSGIIAWINRGKPGRVIALRADMDALPMDEKNEIDYASCHSGCMHACGHDAHAAMLLGTAKILNEHRNELNGEVRLLFQTAEEQLKGAEVMIRNHALDGVDAVFGMHIGTTAGIDIPSGTFTICPGTVMSSIDRFIITVKGTGCHGSTPELGIDPINIAGHIILGLEAINSREFNAFAPVVLTIGKISCGSQFNIIPDTLIMEGTTRTVDAEVRKKVARRIGEISRGIAKSFGGEADVEIDWCTPPVVNDPAMAKLAAECAKAVIGEAYVLDHVPTPNTGGEDFAYYLEHVPGAFMFLSSADSIKKTNIAHHSPFFNIDEDVLWEGPAVFSRITKKFLNDQIWS